MFDIAIIALLVFMFIAQVVIVLVIRRERRVMGDIFAILLNDIKENLRNNRHEQDIYIGHMSTSITQQIQSVGTMQKQQLDSFNRQLAQLTHINESKLENIRLNVEDKLNRIQHDTAHKLEQMRQTVEEKLHNTLEQRLGDSFKLVSERLELVHKGLGEMQSLASGVGDLKKVLTNVKTRGLWGEVQLESLLMQMLSVEQYGKNVAVVPGSSNRVEFAIKLPGKNNDTDMWLPIDAKFPIEDYQRFLDVQDGGDAIEIESHAKQLEMTLRKVAKMIQEKYVHPPHTTDFAVMFLPIESLYAEVTRRPGLMESLQNQYRIIVTGPTSLSAILTSLQMGFKTLAIEKRSSEVWKVLNIVRTEFLKFSDLLVKTKEKLDQASKVIGDAETKSRTIQRHLRNAQETDPLLQSNVDIEAKAANE